MRDGDAQVAGEHDLAREPVEVEAGPSSADADNGDGGRTTSNARSRLGVAPSLRLT